MVDATTKQIDVVLRLLLLQFRQQLLLVLMSVMPMFLLFFDCLVGTS